MGKTVSLTPSGDLRARDLIRDCYLALPDEEREALPLPGGPPSSKLLLMVLMLDGAARLEIRSQAETQKEIRKVVERWCRGEVE